MLEVSPEDLSPRKLRVRDLVRLLADGTFEVTRAFVIRGSKGQDAAVNVGMRLGPGGAFADRTYDWFRQNLDETLPDTLKVV